MEDTHQITKLKEPVPMSQLLCSGTMWMQLTYCCDTFKLVRVGCTIGSILRPNQIKSRSSMFLLLCLGLRPHWCILRKWHFHCLSIGPVVSCLHLIYTVLICALSDIFLASTSPLSLLQWCLKYAAVRIPSRVNFKTRKDHDFGTNLAMWSSTVLKKCVQAYQSPRDCARLNSWPEFSCFF